MRRLLSQPIHTRGERNELPSANQDLFKAEPKDGHAVCTLQVHVLTHLPFLQRTSLKVTSQDESVMLSTDGFISESVNLCFRTGQQDAKMRYNIRE